MLGILGAIFSTIFGSIVDSIKGRREIKQAAIAQRIRNIGTPNKNNDAAQISALEDKGRWLRRMSFVATIGLLVWYFLAPQHIRSLLNTMPKFLDWALATIFTSIWGKDVVGSIVGLFKK